MEGSKIQLSPLELSLVCDAEIILTKNRIIKKAIALLAEVQTVVCQLQDSDPLPSPLGINPKISKGENYLGLPYAVLDYPRVAKEGNLFFIRSMFWWGNFFSSTLHLAGSYREEGIQKIAESYYRLARHQYYIGIAADPWIHHFLEDNYKPISDLSPTAFRELLKQQEHIKIAAKWPLEDWTLAATKFVESWKLLMRLVS